MSLLNLEEIINQLNPQTREKFFRFFEIHYHEGSLKIPETMKSWVQETFNNLEAVKHQQIIKINNKVTQEGVLFNSLRSQRPDQTHNDGTLEELIKKTEGKSFCNPEKMTPEDPFGRVRGAYCITASNVAKADYWHGVLIFHKHHPLDWNKEEIVDFLATANQWFSRVNQEDTSANYPFIFWNCLWRAAASIVHGHMQMTVSSTPYAKKRLLAQQVKDYQNLYQSDYFDDLYQIHNALGLTLPTRSSEIKAFVPICPPKEKGVTILSNKFNQSLWETFANIMVKYRDKLGVKTFNVGITLPPIAGESTQWNLPVIAEIAARGNLDSQHSDIGGMEKFAQEVITHDPFATCQVLIS